MEIEPRHIDERQVAAPSHLPETSETRLHSVAYVQQFFEPCVTLLYRGQADQAAYTVMDGPFHSLFPYGGGLFTLTSVRHTPLARTDTFEEARGVLAGVYAAHLAQIRNTIELDFVRFYPAFHERLEFIRFDFAIKTKLRDASDARVPIVSGGGRIVHVLAGKIDAIFEAADEVCVLLGVAPAISIP